MRLWPAAVLAIAAIAGSAGAGPFEWDERAPLPLPRTEIAAASVGNEIVVVGGFTADGGSSSRADAYSPLRDSWRRLPDLPLGVNHAMAVGVGRKVYVLGGGTTRTGWTGAVRLTGSFFDQNANVTLVRSAFDDTGLLVPYVPDVVVRSDRSILWGYRPRADSTWTWQNIGAPPGGPATAPSAAGQAEPTLPALQPAINTASGSNSRNARSSAACAFCQPRCSTTTFP